MSGTIVAGGQRRKLTCRQSPPGTVHPYMVQAPRVEPLPEEVDLRCGLPMLDQGQLGTCVDNAWSRMMMYIFVRALVAAGMPLANAVAQAFVYSRLFLYFYVRAAEGTPPTVDGGSQVGTPGYVLTTLGVPPESDYPYDVTKFAETPPDTAMAAAAAHKALLYFHLPDTQSIKRSLADGFTVAIGMHVYPEMENAPCITSGVVPMPTAGETSLGGHCVLLVGYKLVNGVCHWIVDNSWGEGAGDKGCFYLPVDYPVFDAMTLRRDVG